MLLGLFAGLALVLSAAGVYGVMSYGVTQRQREIGIRIALGAKFGDVTGMVLRDVATVAAIGIGAGVVAALAFARVMTSVLYGVGVVRRGDVRRGAGGDRGRRTRGWCGSGGQSGASRSARRDER